LCHVFLIRGCRFDQDVRCEFDREACHFIGHVLGVVADDFEVFESVEEFDADVGLAKCFVDAFDDMLEGWECLRDRLREDDALLELAIVVEVERDVE
jgi:hypothetical protein